MLSIVLHLVHTIISRSSKNSLASSASVLKRKGSGREMDPNPSLPPFLFVPCFPLVEEAYLDVRDLEFREYYSGLRCARFLQHWVPLCGFLGILFRFAADGICFVLLRSVRCSCFALFSIMKKAVMSSSPTNSVRRQTPMEVHDSCSANTSTLGPMVALTREDGITPRIPSQLSYIRHMWSYRRHMWSDAWHCDWRFTLQQDECESEVATQNK